MVQLPLSSLQNTHCGYPLGFHSEDAFIGGDLGWKERSYMSAIRHWVSK